MSRFTILCFLTDMDTRKYVSVPVIRNFVNLVVYPLNQNVGFRFMLKINLFYQFQFQGASSLYVLSTSIPTLNVTKNSVQVELLPDHAYCLLPSVNSEIGFWSIFPRKPVFIEDLKFGLFLGKVRSFLIKNNSFILILRLSVTIGKM